MKNHQTIYSFIWAGILLIALISCNSGSEPLNQNIFSAPETIDPPIVIKAGKPVNIVKAHDGSIKIRSNQNEGTTFAIELSI